MRQKVRSFSVVMGLCLMVAGCTASRPPSYNLPDRDSLVAGEKYTVGRGENVYAIALKNGVKLRDVVALNDLKPPFVLQAGQVLTLPAKDKYAAPTPEAAPLDYIDKGSMAPPSNGNGGSAGVTSVQSQELPPLSSSQVKAAPLDSSSTGTVQPTVITSAPQPARTEWQQTPQPHQEPAPPATSAEPAPPQLATTQAAAPTTILEQQSTQTAATSSAAADPNAIPVFGWPVRGTVISGFGPKGQGLDNDGINIAAPKGAPVKAAGGGIVAYAGNEMKGFGNLVLVRHEGGWVTAYAHLERMVVAKDSIVAKGDMLGTVGATGNVSSPQLHFETRREGKPVDPELMLK